MMKASVCRETIRSFSKQYKKESVCHEVVVVIGCWSHTLSARTKYSNEFIILVETRSAEKVRNIFQDDELIGQNSVILANPLYYVLMCQQFLYVDRRTYSNLFEFSQTFSITPHKFSMEMFVSTKRC